MERSNQLPSYQHNDYIIILNPKEELQSRILTIKESFKEKYKTEVYVTKPYITLVKFSSLQITEDKLVHELQKIGNNRDPFKIDLRDYGSYPTHSIFINIITKNAIHELIKDLKKIRYLMKTANHDPYFITEPNINIALKLLPWQYEKAWLEYSYTAFSGSFMADEMILLRKKEGDTKYKAVCRLGFMYIPEKIAQGNLFI
ncbi:MAG: 2'-5' RNA ligase family protein [Sphingobacteriales bacterium]|nr:2'-5' RNA ligase family protein [Sphingobacteriales bacterium]